MSIATPKSANLLEGLSSHEPVTPQNLHVFKERVQLIGGRLGYEHLKGYEYTRQSDEDGSFEGVTVRHTPKGRVELNDRVFIKDEYQYVCILLSEIDFVKSNGNYIEIHSHGKRRLIKKALKDIESKLDANFFQVHRSYIVNIRKIERVGGNSLWIGQTEIPIIKQQREQLLLLFNVLS